MSDTKEQLNERYRVRAARRFLKVIGIDLPVKKREAPAPPIAELHFQPRAKVRRPDANYPMIYDEAIKSWVFRQIARAIIQEVIVPEIKLSAKFAMKCVDCDMDHETIVEECSACGSKQLREPDQTERQKAQKIIDSPNPDYSMVELNRSALYWHLMLDDTYFSIAYKKGVKAKVSEGTVKTEVKRIPEHIYIEDSRFVLPVADQYGKYGNDEYFCPVCYDPQYDNIVRYEPNEEEPTSCPDCKGVLLQTVYVISFGDKIKHRYGKNEIQQGSTDRLLPALFGNPKMVSLFKPLKTINHMDDYSEEAWGRGTTGGFVAFLGMSQEDVGEIEAKINTQIAQKNRRDPVSGQVQESNKIHTFLLGVEEHAPEYIEIMPDSQKMQSLEWYKLYRDSICAVYGVTPVFVGIIESGKSGNNPRMQIDVQKGTTEEHQQFLSNMWNGKIFPIFEIYDWEIQFGAIEQVDDLRQAQVWEHRGKAAETFINLGFTVTLDEHDNLKVSREREEPEEEENPEQDDQEESEPMEDEVSEESGDWNPSVSRTLNEIPDSAEKIRLRLIKDFTEIIDGARNLNNEKASYAQAKKAMDKAHLEIVESARIALEHTMKTKLPKVPPHIMKKLNEIRNERMRDFRKLLREELKREDE